MQHRLVRALALAVLATLIGAFHNGWRRWPVDLWPATGPPCPRPVELQTAKDWFVHRQCIFLDTRPTPEFERCHIAGAVREIPQWDDSGPRIVLCGPCPGQLCQTGCEVFVLNGGLEAWKESGCPVEP